MEGIRLRYFKVITVDVERVKVPPYTGSGSGSHSRGSGRGLHPCMVSVRSLQGYLDPSS